MDRPHYSGTGKPPSIPLYSFDAHMSYPHPPGFVPHPRDHTGYLLSIPFDGSINGQQQPHVGGFGGAPYYAGGELVNGYVHPRQFTHVAQHHGPAFYIPSTPHDNQYPPHVHDSRAQGRAEGIVPCDGNNRLIAGVLCSRGDDSPYDALEDLDGAQGYPAASWREYYLRHAAKINTLLNADGKSITSGCGPASRGSFAGSSRVKDSPPGRRTRAFRSMAASGSANTKPSLDSADPDSESSDTQEHESEEESLFELDAQKRAEYDAVAEWVHVHGSKDWAEFASKHDPPRSAQAWRSFYTRWEEREIRPRIKKLQARSD